MGLCFTVVIPGIDRWSKRFFLSYFVVYLLSILSSLVEVLFRLYHPIHPALFYFLLVLESLLLFVPMPMLTVYLLHCCGKNLRQSRLLRVVLGLCILTFFLFAGSLFIEGFCYVAPDNQYTRGPLYPLVLLPAIAILLLNLAETIRRRRLLSRKAFLGFLVALVPMTLALTIQLFIDVYPLFDTCCILASLSMYSFILSDQIEQDRRRQQDIARQQEEIARQQMEIANQHASIMVLQMRPHFIYNTMTSIYCLCNQDPQLARRVVMEFTTYLRKNFTAIASDAPIPFSSELEHTRAYLAVEQAMYEDSLFVDYDTPHTWFRVPPLTLQPIVENAVKHGKDPYSGPLRISIRTRHTESGNEIIVEDNGRGFSPSDEGDLGIALQNIRQRLRMMCGGSLSIRPGENGGTVTTVILPDGDAQ
jgi:hypothetical protein